MDFIFKKLFSVFLAGLLLAFNANAFAQKEPAKQQIENKDAEQKKKDPFEKASDAKEKSSNKTKENPGSEKKTDSDRNSVKAGGKELKSSLAKSEKKSLPKKINLEEIIDRLIKKNFDVRMASLRYLMATSDEDKFRAQYGFYFKGDAGYSYNKPPENGRNYLYEGSKQYQKTLNAFIAKSFRSGTRLNFGITSTYTDSGVDPNVLAGTDFADLGESLVVPPLYHSSLVVELRQSLLKNFFGVNDRNMEKIMSNVSRQNEVMTMQVLSGLIVEALVYYWNIAVLEMNLKAIQDQLDSTRRVQRITIRQVRLGLAENIDLLQWNSQIIAYQSQVKLARRELNEGRRQLLEAIQMPQDTVIETVTSLKTEIAPPSMEKMLDKAYKSRPDLISAKLTMESARLALENAKRGALPSLDLVLQARTQGREEKFFKSFNDVPIAKYPSLYAGVEMTAPLYDTGTSENIRDHLVQYEQARTNYRKLKQDIRTELESLQEETMTLQEVYKDSVKSENLARQYYNGIMHRYRQGRYSTLMVKNAIDNYTKARLGKTKALVGLNIAALRLDFAQNRIFERFGIKEKVIVRTLKKYLQK